MFAGYAVLIIGAALYMSGSGYAIGLAMVSYEWAVVFLILGVVIVVISLLESDKIEK